MPRLPVGLLNNNGLWLSALMLIGSAALVASMYV
jgi:hypothetical protein